LSAAALIGGLGGGFLLAFLLVTSLKDKAAPAGDTATAASPGAVIGGCYQVVREIGRGGMGVVFEADDLALGRKVALKRMKDTLKRDPADKEQFMEEARTVAALRHPNIVAIHSIFEEGEDLYLVFEFVPGMTLDEHLYRRKRLSPAEARDILKPVCDALAYAHGRKVIHRDLKPSNIMMTEDGQVKVMDFGLARQAKDTLSALSRTDAAGTPAYMAPEMERGLVRRESDIYMLGGVLYEMLTGELPTHHVGGLPPEIASVIAKAMEREPELRYHSPQALLDAFDVALKTLA
jgi:serine/threonine protein kinase